MMDGVIVTSNWSTEKRGELKCDVHCKIDINSETIGDDGWHYWERVIDPLKKEMNLNLMYIEKLTLNM